MKKTWQTCVVDVTCTEDGGQQVLFTDQAHVVNIVSFVPHSLPHSCEEQICYCPSLFADGNFHSRWLKQQNQLTSFLSNKNRAFSAKQQQELVIVGASELGSSPCIDFYTCSFGKICLFFQWSKHMKQDILRSQVFLSSPSRYIVRKSLELTY